MFEVVGDHGLARNDLQMPPSDEPLLEHRVELVLEHSARVTVEHDVRADDAVARHAAATRAP